MLTVWSSLLDSARFLKVCARNSVPGEAEAAGSLGGEQQPPVSRGISPTPPPVIWELWLMFASGKACAHVFYSLLVQPSAVSNSSQGPPSVADSAAEYFDASDDIPCASSSEVSDESGLSDGSTTNSEPEEGHGGCKMLECSEISPKPNTTFWDSKRF